MAFDKEWHLNFIKLSVESVVRQMDDCSSFSHITRDGLNGAISSAVKEGHITYEEFWNKYWRTINDAAHKFNDNCKCRLI